MGTNQEPGSETQNLSTGGLSVHDAHPITGDDQKQGGSDC